VGLWTCQQVLRTVLVSRLMGLQQSGSRSFEFQPCRVRGFLSRYFKLLEVSENPVHKGDFCALEGILVHYM